MKLYVDDERVEPLGWVRCSNATNAIAILQGGEVTELALDHDLDSFIDTRGGESKELTGYDVAVWLEEQAANGNWKCVPRVITCHSDNPAGRARIVAAVLSIQRMRNRVE